MTEGYIIHDLNVNALESGRTLFFEKAAKGDIRGTLESLGLCVEVLEIFPGLCRFLMM